jgi:magnesium transporter
MKTPVVPSKSLLRFLRSQSAFASLHHPPSSLRPPPGNQKSCRGLTTSSSRASRNTSSAPEDIWHRHREPFKALPPPKYHPPKPPQTRNASTESHSPGFWRRWLRHRQALARSKIPPDPHAGNSYEETSAQLFNLSRTLSRNAAGADQKLRCTEFDANGSVTLVSGEFKKSELIAKYGLLPRDLRKIDSSVLPHILVRPTAILINLLHLRVLIQSDRVLVFDAYGSTDSYTQSLFMYDLEGKLRQKADPRNGSTYLPYELRALEAVLISVTSGLEAEFALVREPVAHILQALEEDIDRDKLRHLLIHSKKLGTFEQKARLVRDAIDDLLEADDDLAAMYLTERKANGKAREEDNHQEVEMLLESYHKICDEIVEISGLLISNIRNTEEVVKAILDANRNQLMLLEIKFSIGTLGLAGGTLVAGLYGMNLKNFIEESDLAFGGVSVVCFALSAIICVYGMRKLRKVQKVRMWGEGIDVFGRQPRASGRGNWRNEAVESQAQRLSRLRRSGANYATHPAQSGPVLWPGMEGLGVHKLNTDGEDDRRSGELDTNSDSDAPGHEDSGTTIHEDLKSVDARMRADADQEKGVSVKSGHHHHRHHDQGHKHGKK